VRKFIVPLVVAAGLLVCGATTANAHDAYDDSESNPLRIVAYGVYPVGYLLEHAIFRPIHFLVSNPQLEPMFGHGPHENAFGGYRAYDIDER
jgi:hypothetical protein